MSVTTMPVVPYHVPRMRVRETREDALLHEDVCPEGYQIWSPQQELADKALAHVSEDDLQALVEACTDHSPSFLVEDDGELVDIDPGYSRSFLPLDEPDARPAWVDDVIADIYAD